VSTLRLATRCSPLALVQAHYVRDRLSASGVDAQLIHIETDGDRRLDVPLETLGGQGVFAVEIQTALLDGRADVAVHSAKDLPSLTPTELTLACVPERLDPADVLVGRSLAGLGPGATVATGSPRRRALLLERRPDINVIGLRGNMATRLSAAGSNGVDAVIAAAAALQRLGHEQMVAERLDPTWFVPQVGQGALALEVRREDEATSTLLATINDMAAFVAVRAERAFLRELGAGCSIPAGAHATCSNGSITIAGVMLADDGARSVRATLIGDDPDEVGRELAVRLRDREGGSTLSGWRS
jgi:hydroxymethylbilane synthase